MEIYDCVVLGVGGFGSAALFHLARRGLRVLGIERFGVAHDRGSSHGETRMIRKAYFEHPDYVPLLVRAYDQWRELESEVDRSLLRQCGLIITGPPNGESIEGAKFAAKTFGVPLEVLELAEARRRFPGHRFPDEFAVAFEPDGGYLHVEECVRSHIDAAVKHGAAMRTNAVVVNWESDGRRVVVRTEDAKYDAAALIVTAGAWAGRILADLQVPLSVVRKPLFWYATTSRDYDVDRGAPAFYYEWPTGLFYGFPSIDGSTVKLADHSGGEPVSDPLLVDREVYPADVQPVSEFIKSALPGVTPQPVRHAVCMYTNTPDRNFIVDRHPAYENVVIGAGFSGHGFKFTTVLGEALADLAVESKTDLPIGFLSLSRDALKRK